MCGFCHLTLVDEGVDKPANGLDNFVQLFEGAKVGEPPYVEMTPQISAHVWFRPSMQKTLSYSTL